MDEGFKHLLAAWVLNDGHVVRYETFIYQPEIPSTHASWSRLLFEFHRQEITKKPGSVHATYLISGERRPATDVAANGESHTDGEDRYMQSSPFMSSPPQNQSTQEESIPVHSITLARQEDLEDCNRDISSKYADEDPLEVGGRYGIIRNPNVKRRSTRRPPPPAAEAPMASKNPTGSSAQALNVKKESTSEKKASANPSKEIKIPEAKSATPDATTETKEGKTRKANVKPSIRRDTSDIFKSFAKSQPKLKRKDTDSSAEASPALSAPDSAEPSAREDEPMKDASEDEQEEDFVVNKFDGKDESRRQAKSQREDELRKMMEEEDELMPDPPPVPVEVPQDIETAEPEEPEVQKEETLPVTVSGGRRRGRRKVLRKKTIKDEEGYLVTKEEPVWESFSEEEPEPRKAKSSTPAAVSTSKHKKASGKGQGNIMSFFSKK
ncbi:MAG: hypothetical protein M1819_001214 [Sarea resinae]|nr:MAG: hypothetical protein M1819_001214 [Sarea resinae]